MNQTGNQAGNQAGSGAATMSESTPGSEHVAASRRMGSLAIWAYAACVAWGLMLVMLGVTRGDEAWSMFPLVGGIVVVIWTVVAALRQSPHAAAFGSAAITAIIPIAVIFAVRGSDVAVVLAAIGMLCLTVIVAAIPVTMALLRLAQQGAMASAARAAGGVGGDDVVPLLNQIHDHVLLSDNAKRVLFREREVQMMRQTIEDDIKAGKYDLALTICDEIADVFGYREEAESFRMQILQRRQVHNEQQVGAAISELDQLLLARRWQDAHHHAMRLRRLFPDSHHVHHLDQRFMAARDHAQRELEGAFREAAGRDDVETAMPILRELDQYLTPEDGERLREIADGVVRKHRDNLGTQFKLAVNDHRWAQAAAIGETIISEFPNTKMADEARSMIGLLRSRAAGNPTGTAQENAS